MGSDAYLDQTATLLAEAADCLRTRRSKPGASKRVIGPSGGTGGPAPLGDCPPTRDREVLDGQTSEDEVPYDGGGHADDGHVKRFLRSKMSAPTRKKKKEEEPQEPLSTTKLPTPTRRLEWLSHDPHRTNGGVDRTAPQGLTG
ncbi:hypothetical protein PPTG_15917 [Phytophthora nicotianae INRA-310]|uniref:Uncharacterized protein n=1 Tax=Phytophthora nicotianae (strain INRA-310) TaxID=761204 RepID=W2PTZ8_PHYN3|nr:hypothetical protein PPTG_15917 [Phytophthora nicotianae INRA-310]ETN03699.1 hypothetical protein PPTG_15917 [Phytophthora nicotianae INRA-310]